MKIVTLNSRISFRRLDMRHVQSILGLIWSLDGLLQLQHVMFTRWFLSQVLTPAAANQPGFVSSPIRWSIQLIGSHVAEWNLLFAAIQLLIGICLLSSFRVRFTLYASIIWSLVVWWLGEGFGEILTGTGTPLTGAPGAVILYALIAVVILAGNSSNKPLLMTTSNEMEESAGYYADSQVIGHQGWWPGNWHIRSFIGELLWSIVWILSSIFVLLPNNRKPNSIASSIELAQSGQPGWLRAFQQLGVDVSRNHGADLAIALSGLQLIVGLGIFYKKFQPVCLLLGSVLAIMFWIFGQSLGGLLTGSATDPNTGPLLIVLGLAIGLPIPELTIQIPRQRKTTSYFSP